MDTTEFRARLRATIHPDETVSSKVRPALFSQSELLWLLEREKDMEIALARIESDHTLSRAECAVIAAEALEL